MNTTISGVPPVLIDALNQRSRIGDPWRSPYHVSIPTKRQGEAETLLELLQRIGITAQINGNGSTRYVMIYDQESQSRLLAELGPEIHERKRVELDQLVRARGPVPAWLVYSIRTKHHVYGWDWQQIAGYLNRHQILDGMGGKTGWTVKKVKAAYRSLPA